MNHLETYLTHLHDARSTGEAVKETSFYPAIAALFNSFGAELKPKVKCVINIKNRGAGIPDGGLFTTEQLRTNDAEAVANVKGFNGQIPARGVIEVKGTREDVRRIAAGEQVEKYLRHYGLVLVTNLREFLIVERNEHGKARTLAYIEAWIFIAEHRSLSLPSVRSPLALLGTGDELDRQKTRGLFSLSREQKHLACCGSAK